jgi:pyruvate,water dikinase
MGMAGYIVSYEEAVAFGSPIVGGKGWNLGRLHHYGFTVPTGGILIAQTYTRFMQDPRLHALCADLAGVHIRDVAEMEVVDRLHGLRVAIEETAFSKDVEEAVLIFLTESGLAEVPVAVRSSATAEDSAAASFAGIHESFLNVTGYQGILQAIKCCYASLWTPHALIYRRQQGLADEAVASAVVICAMITGPRQSPPTAAGVAFSCDPRTGQCDRVCIDAAPGWGDAVVRGNITPEAITVVQRGDGELVRIERSKGNSPVLSDVHVVALASLVRGVLWALGEGQTPQDVEWVYDGELFWLLQARPVTHVPRVILPAVEKIPTIWSNANLKDVMPNVLTPFSWSLLQPLVSTILYAPCQAVGSVLPDGIEVMRRFSGRAYFDLTTMLWSYYDTFGILPHKINEGMGGYQPEIPVPSKHPLRGWAGIRRIRGRIRLLRAIARANRSLSREMHHLRAQARVQAHQPLTDLRREELLALLRQVHEQAWAFGFRFQLANLGGVWTDYLTQTLERAGLDQAQAISAALMAGSRAVESAEQGYRLYEVAIAAGRDPDAGKYLAVPSADPNSWLSLPAHSAFRQAFTAFLDEFGHRGVYEFELANPRWNENPSYLLDCIRGISAQAMLTVPYEQARVKRQEAETAVARLPLRLRLLVSWLAHQSRRAVAMREAGKSTLVALLEPIRAIAIEVGMRIVVAQMLEAKEDVFFLTWSEVLAFLCDKWDGQGAQALVEDRKKQHAVWLIQVPADVFFADPVGYTDALAVVDEDGLEETRVRKQTLCGGKEEPLHGIAASPGQVSGRARILFHPDEGRNLQAGEVLVAPSTDPAWTPLFLRASAVVMETGGYLSHGAIVAREFGIPAVINIPGFLKSVKDGQWLTVDGNRGLVTLGDVSPLVPQSVN